MEALDARWERKHSPQLIRWTQRRTDSKGAAVLEVLGPG